MEKALVVGDSLAGGLPHVNFWMQLRKMAGDYSFTASAVGGDPLGGICSRLDSLVAETGPDLLILVAGANDILLPSLRARGGNWLRLVNRIEKRGSLPIEDVNDFLGLYCRTIEKTMAEVERLVVTTSTCLGEDLGSEPNRRRSEYNAAIRALAEQHNLVLADTAKAFDGVLENVDDPSCYFLDRFICTFTDTFHALLLHSADTLSGRRGLAPLFSYAKFMWVRWGDPISS